jgi:hypothetical protein
VKRSCHDAHRQNGVLSKIAENEDGGACVDQARRFGVPKADETDAYHRTGQRKEEQRDPFIGPPKKKCLALAEIP